MICNNLFITSIFVSALNFIVINAIDVNTTSGLVRGSSVQALNQTIDIFLGIPYAEPPIGDLRFRKPVPKKSSNNGKIVNRLDPISCIQSEEDPNIIFPNFPNVTQTEDCLVLNIYTPDLKHSKRLRPVMFWIHGGSLLVGTIFQYNGTYLATHDVVLVATNYRLGPYGFFYGGSDSAPGNQGLYDQRLALLWVKENIKKFGGDPHEITIFGESSGSMSVSAQILSPLSRGLFKRSIIESGVILHDKQGNIQNTTQALQQTIQAAAKAGCADPNTFVDCLRKLDTNVISNLNTFPLILEGTEYVPVSTQKAFKDHNYNRDIDILAGVMRDEGSGTFRTGLKVSGINIDKDFTVDEFKNIATIYRDQFIPYLNVEKVTDFYLKNINVSNSASLAKAAYDCYGDGYITCPTYLFTKQFSKHNPKKNVFFFEFTYAHLDLFPGCDPATDDVCHEAELAYVFGTPYTESDALQIDIDYTAEIMKLWTNFAKYGNPISDTTRTRQWPPLYSHGHGHKVKELNAFNFDGVFDNRYKVTCDDFWAESFF